MITREKLLERKKALEAERDTLLNNLNAVGGALQLLEMLLKEIDDDDAPKES
jgi:hypothetical protein